MHTNHASTSCNSTPDTGVPALAPRSAHGHKGTFGRVVVVGGCSSGRVRMAGAPALAARGAFRSGCGTVHALVPEPIAHTLLTLSPSCTAWALAVDGRGALIAHEAAAALDEALAGAQALAIGPGMGTDEHGGDRSVEALVLRAVQQARVPVVVDADGLNALARIPDLTRDLKGMCVLTPHPGEFRRLAEALNITEDATSPASRARGAEALAQRLGCVVVLKGAGTVVTDGHETWVCPHGHACLATGGTGDVLTGVAAGLIAQWRAGGLTTRGAATPPDGISTAVMRGPVTAPSRLSDDDPHLARVMSRDELMLLAAAKLGKSARQPPAASAPTGTASPPPLSLVGVTRLAVQVHAMAGEAWARQHHSDAGALAQEIADCVPEVLRGLRSGATPIG